MEQNKNDAAGIFSNTVDTAFLVVTNAKGNGEYTAENLLAELSALVDTMGFQILGHEIVKVRKIESRFFIGTGKTAEIIAKAKELEVDCIVFDDDLSPSQQRNWEEESGICVIDRREVILDIFSARATTREAVLQVGLARMEYSLPRLTRAWTHLSRQKGGTKGTRGEGETQLEMDRRLVENKIHRMEKELIKLRQTRSTMSKLRRNEQIPTLSLIGYTNAGKSSLLNALAGSTVFVENKLFATLDPTTRRIELEGGHTFLLTDTVGFIRKLPHDLVETFKSTLEETRDSDFLIHVLDATNPEILHHYKTTRQVLEELGVVQKPTIVVFNKIDKEHDETLLLPLRQSDELTTCISAKTGQGIPELLKIIVELIYEHFQNTNYFIPASRYDLVALIHRKGQIIREEHRDTGVAIVARVPANIRSKLEEFIATEVSEAHDQPVVAQNSSDL